jgi:hypothetical protein
MLGRLSNYRLLNLITAILSVAIRLIPPRGVLTTAPENKENRESDSDKHDDIGMRLFHLRSSCLYPVFGIWYPNPCEGVLPPLEAVPLPPPPPAGGRFPDCWLKYRE